MRKFLGVVFGVVLGAAVGVATVRTLDPEAGEDLRRELKEGFEETMAEARKASAARRTRLEAKVAQMRAEAGASTDGDRRD